MYTEDFPANPIEKAGYRLEFHDEFESNSLNLQNWIPHYLPHWSSRARSTPRYSFTDSALVLQIDENQEPWCPEFDGDVIVSSLQTGLFAGPLGSTIGQHHFKATCHVRETQEKQRTYTPQFGYFETRIKAEASPENMVTLWMIGLEEQPEESGEICLFEVFGSHITPAGSELRYGIHPFADETLSDEFYRDTLPIDASKYHIYAAEWTPHHVDFYLDNSKLRRINQSPQYPMQFMLGIYELPGLEDVPSSYPKRYTIDYFRAYQPIDGYSK